jgi:hypothetical protein
VLSESKHINLLVLITARLSIKSMEAECDMTTICGCNAVNTATLLLVVVASIIMPLYYSAINNIIVITQNVASNVFAVVFVRLHGCRSFTVGHVQCTM